MKKIIFVFAISGILLRKFRFPSDRNAGHRINEVHHQRCWSRKSQNFGQKLELFQVYSGDLNNEHLNKGNI